MITYGQFEQTARYLKDATLRRFLRQVCGLTPRTDTQETRRAWEAERIDSAVYVLMLVGDWLLTLGLFNEGQVYAIVGHVRGPLWAERLATIQQHPWHITLSVADARWITYTGNEQLFDAEEGTTIDLLPRRAVTHVSLDVVAAHQRVMAKFQRNSPCPTK